MEKSTVNGAPARLCVVLPVYNEADVIEQVIRDIHDKVITRVSGAELLIVEDGSTDGTPAILRRLGAEIPFTLLSGRERKGYTRAFKDALTQAKGDLIFFCDSDGQHDPLDILRMLELADRWDIVGGCKTPRQDPFARLLLSRGYNLLVRLLFGLGTKDIDAGFKLIRGSVVAAVIPELAGFRQCVMSEFVIRACLKGFRIKEIPVAHFPRKGASRIFSPARLPGIIGGVVTDLLRLKFSTKRKSA